MIDQYELKYYGVGMKWGHRRSIRSTGVRNSESLIRMRAGLTKKRTLALLKKDLSLLESGKGALRKGITKKRQEEFREKDVALYKKRISDLESGKIKNGRLIITSLLHDLR